MLANIEAERARCGYSKESLSKKLAITSRTYHNYLHGSPIPSNVLIRMAQVFGCSVDYLLGVQPRQKEG